MIWKAFKNKVEATGIKDNTQIRIPVEIDGLVWACIEPNDSVDDLRVCFDEKNNCCQIQME